MTATRKLAAALPWLMALAALVLWEALVRINQIPPYVLPAPSRVLATLISDWPVLGRSWLVTLEITFMALILAALGGAAAAVLFSLSRWVEASLVPFAVVLQVTPLIAIAPLIVIYAPTTFAAVLLCAFMVAFFPVLANTLTGLKSADHGLEDLFQLYGASRWQRLRRLLVPTALPYFLTGLRIAGGLSLIGAVVAEFAAGTAGHESGLAYRILESSYRLNIPRMFAALVLISLTGIAIYAILGAVSNHMLKNWHESVKERE